MLFAGQLVVTVTVSCGFIVEVFTGEKNTESLDMMTGGFLVVINVVVVALSLWVQRVEKVHHCLDAIKRHAPFDVQEFSQLWKDSTKRPLCLALLTTSSAIIKRICGKGESDDSADESWRYLKVQVFELKDEEGAHVLSSPVVNASKEWWPLVSDIVEHRLKEFMDASVTGVWRLSFDEDSFCDAAMSVLGPLVTSDSARAEFAAQLSARVSANHDDDDISIDEIFERRASEFDMENSNGSAVAEVELVQQISSDNEFEGDSEADSSLPWKTNPLHSNAVFDASATDSLQHHTSFIVKSRPLSSNSDASDVQVGMMEGTEAVEAEEINADSQTFSKDGDLLHIKSSDEPCPSVEASSSSLRGTSTWEEAAAEDSSQHHASSTVHSYPRSSNSNAVDVQIGMEQEEEEEQEGASAETGETKKEREFDVIFENGLPKLSEVQREEEITKWDKKPLKIELETTSNLGEDNLKLFFRITKKADLLVRCFDIQDEFLGEYNLGNIY